MSCFWTDLVSATQQCEDSSLRLAIGTTALEAPTPSAIATLASTFYDDFAGDTSGFNTIHTILSDASAGGSSFPTEAARAVYNNCAFFDHTATAQNTAGFTDQEGRYITGYAEFLVPGPLTVAGCWYLDYDGCGNPLAAVDVVSVPSTGASASIDSSGLLEVTPPTDWGASTGGIIDFVMRITGTITGENGSTVDADFYVLSNYNGCS